MKTQAVPKLVTQLWDHEIVIPAVLFHFDHPHAVAHEFAGRLAAIGICSVLCQAYEALTPKYWEDSLEKTYAQVSKALMLWDAERRDFFGDWYLEDYIYYRYGFDVRHSGDRHVVMPNLRREWQKHIVKHLLASED